MLQESLGSRFRRVLIGDRAFYHRVVSIALPIIIQNTISNVVSLLDNVMVGRVGTLEMSAVSIVNQLLFLCFIFAYSAVWRAQVFSLRNMQVHVMIRAFDSVSESSGSLLP